MKIYIASDHAAYEKKDELRDYCVEKGHELIDLGTNSSESTNYPIYAHKLTQEVINNEGSLGILLCGSGIGVSMVANRTKGIRAALCRTVWDAEMSRRHNNANVICLGGRVSEMSDMKMMVDTFLETEFEGGRHQTRIDLF